MKRKKITNIESVFDQWVEHNPRIQQGLYAKKAENILKTQLGPLKKYLSRVECRGRILYVTLYSSTMRAKMYDVKDNLIRLINTELGATFLQDIHFS